MNQLAKPPVVDTNIATSEQFYSHSVNGLPAKQVLAYTDFYADLPSGFVAPTWSGLADQYGNTQAQLRSVNPELSAAYTGSSFDINAFRQIDSSYYWLNGFSYYITAPAQPAPRLNFQQRYAPSSPGILGMDRAPVGHGPANQGIYAWVATQDASLDGILCLRGAFHPPALKPQDYATGWQPVSGVTLALPSDDSGLGVLSFRTYGRVASQRLGNWVYMFGYTRKQVISAYGPPDHTGLRQPSRLDNIGKLVIYKIGPDGPVPVLQEDVTTVGEDPVEGSSLVPLPGLETIATASLELGGHCSFFVSDDLTPFIWHTGGDISDQATDNSAVAWSVGFADNGMGLGSWKRDEQAITHVTGQLGAYLQKAVLPAGEYGFGPYLVFPWTAGHYGPPEQWYFILRGASTFDVYRARWLRGQHVRYADVTLPDDPDFNIDARQYPTLNPEGWAFEKSWFSPAHKVGVIGPVSGVDVYNPATATAAYDGTQMRFPYFAVLRDPKRIGQLHLILGDGAPIRSGL